MDGNRAQFMFFTDPKACTDRRLRIGMEQKTPKTYLTVCAVELLERQRS